MNKRLIYPELKYKVGDVVNYDTRPGWVIEKVGGFDFEWWYVSTDPVTGELTVMGEDALDYFKRIAGEDQSELP